MRTAAVEGGHLGQRQRSRPTRRSTTATRSHESWFAGCCDDRPTGRRGGWAPRTLCAMRWTSYLFGSLVSVACVLRFERQNCKPRSAFAGDDFVPVSGSLSGHVDHMVFVEWPMADDVARG
eukprot:5692574-Prymnesium_polylepis.1